MNQKRLLQTRLENAMDVRVPPRVHVDPQVMGGTPVFVGTRLPVVTLLGAVDGGAPWERIVSSWPYITPEHVAAGRAWLAQQPNSKVGPWALQATAKAASR